MVNNCNFHRDCEIPLGNVKHILILWPYSHTPKWLSREMKSVSTKDLCKSFTSALLIVAKYWKHPRSSSTWGLVKKSRCLYTMEQYSAAARNEQIQHNWILNTVCWTQEARHESPHCMISFIQNLRICDDRNQKVVPEGSGQELTGRGESLGWWKGPVFCFWWRLHWYLKLSKLTELSICVSYCMQILLQFFLIQEGKTFIGLAYKVLFIL